jgi:hypothetical protein
MKTVDVFFEKKEYYIADLDTSEANVSTGLVRTTTLSSYSARASNRTVGKRVQDDSEA